MNKIALVIGSLQGGGAERVMATLANAWDERGVQVVLITLRDQNADVYTVNDSVERVVIGLTGESQHFWQKITNNWRRIRAMRKILRECNPDVVLSFMTEHNIRTIAACMCTGYKVVVSDRIFIKNKRLNRAWSLFFRPAYRQAGAVVAQTTDNAAELEDRLARPVHVIPNPIREVCHDEWVEDWFFALKNNGPVLLAMGRLTRQKGFDLLIEAFGRVSVDNPSWTLLILGEGVERPALERQIACEGLNGKVVMPGFVNEPHRIVERVDAFALSSRFEGMPNVLMEAMGAGIACISFDCKTGPRDLIRDGDNGLLVPAENVEALADALGQVMADDVLRRKLGNAATDVRERYSLDAVVEKWNILFKEIGARP